MTRWKTGRYKVSHVVRQGPDDDDEDRILMRWKREHYKASRVVRRGPDDDEVEKRMLQGLTCGKVSASCY